MPYSQTTLEPETTGLANDAEDNFNRQPKVYTVLIFGDEQERIHALTLIMRTPFVTAVINAGDTETDGKSTSVSKHNSLLRKATRSLKLERTSIRNGTTHLSSSG